ncbi:regulatory protein [Sediminibacillus albus]|uniref:Regulatory protein RecX n=1 Tax=Sediminibacillus albus TaxID=407036 RepID=A0A1G9B3S9_9BACI|nr:recombination regulator RecX [Sediminibacillus albus]SDK34153.1 regulatory protein [Sediminibacillus albus]
MAKITRITTQKKSKSRYNIFLDRNNKETYGFSVDEDILIEFHLRKGLDLDESTIEALIQKDNIHKSFTLALNYLSYRMRSKKEIHDYLVKKEVEPDQVPVVVARLENEGFLNDKEFAASLVRTRKNTTSKGPLLVKKELLEKGVPLITAEEAVQLYSYEDQYDKAAKWVEKKLKSNGTKSFRQQVQSLQQTLMQKGFTNDVIKDVLSEINDEKDEDNEWEAVVYQGEKLLRKFSLKEKGPALKHKIKAGLYRKGFSFEHIDRFIEEYVE